MNAITRIGTCGEIVDELIRLHSEGKIKAIAVAVKEERGEPEGDVMQFYWEGFETYAEQIGAVEMIKEAMFKGVLE